MQRGFEDDILRTDGVEQMLLHGQHVYANKLLIESNGQRRLLTEARHVSPLVLAYGLLNGVDVKTCELLKTLHGVVGSEAAIGIDAQLYLFLGESGTNVAYKVKLLVKVDRPNLQFHTSEPGLHFLLQPREHLVIATHPHQAVNGNALLAACERRVEEHVASALKAEQGRLQTKQDRRIRAQHVVVYLARKAEHVAHRIENAFILGYGITAEVWQRRTLSHALAVGLFGRGYGYEPRLACGVDAPRCSCRLFKMQRARFYGHMISHCFFFSL